jgi:hypothetical protein
MIAQAREFFSCISSRGWVRQNAIRPTLVEEQMTDFVSLEAERQTAEEV